MADGATAPIHRSAWVFWALAASLVLNFSLVGGAVGYWIATQRAPAFAAGGSEDLAPIDAEQRAEDPGLWMRELSPRVFISALPPRYRRTATRTVIREGRASVELVRANVEARRAVLDALFVDEFDADAVAAALAHARETENRMVARGHEILLSVLEDIPPEQRGDALTSMRASLVRRGLDGQDGQRRDGPPPRSAPY